ncbi:MAG: Gx transporter family protein, partial [Clostridia bacterium]|nr:Gx transporter family protein [Clostridia bacterium]
CAVFVTVLLLPLYRRERLTFVGVSVAASAAHSLGQLGAASLLLGGAVAAYAPLLLLVSLPTGIVTGLLLNITVDRLRSVLSHI